MMLATIERRAFDLLEIRADPETRIIAGHAAVFNTLSEELFGFREQVAPGAFAQSIGADDIRALFNHDPSLILGRNRSGTLSLAEDETGLAVSIEAPDTQAGRDAITSIRRGDVSGMSFGFITQDDSWDMIDEMVIRTLKRVRLFDVSPVTFPAYPSTDVSVARRSLEAWQREQSPNVGAIARRRKQRLLDMTI
jgi:uncharacterized protein